MYKTVLVMLLIGILATPLLSEQKGTINVTLKPFKKMQGTLFICLYDPKEKFLGNPLQAIQKPVTSNVIEVSFQNLPYGDYAVTAYQDLNQNKKFDIILVFPQEPWGLSENFVPSIGTPTFNDCKFPLNSPEKSIDIKIRD